MLMSTKAWDTIVIGSGISSLTCALLLAKAGQRVLVVERQPKAGGYLHCFSRYGHRFDTGAHYTGGLAAGEPFRALLEHLGAYDPDLFVPLADDFDVLRFKDFEVSFERGYDATIARMTDAFPAERAGIKAYFAAVRDAALSLPTYNFALAAPDDDRVGMLMETPLTAVVERLVQDQRLRMVLYAYCVLHGVAPHDVAFGTHAVVTDSLVRGAWGFRHGGEALAARYLGVLATLGGAIIQGTGVKALHTGGTRQVQSVELDDGRQLTAKNIVAGIHPKAVFRLLHDFRPSVAFASRLGRLTESTPMVGIYAHATAPLPLARNRNYYFFGTDSPAAFATPATLPVAFVCSPDRTGASPADAFPLTLHAPASYASYAPWKEHVAGRKPRAYHVQKRVEAEKWLAMAEAFVPGMRAAVARYDVSTPLSNMRFNGSEEGSAYGIYHGLCNTGARAIGPRTHVENLTLTGQSTLFPGILGAAISGLRTAGSLVGIKHIIRQLSPMVCL